jgi:hypothetical protein
MKSKITYLNTILTIIAIALTIIILQNANIIQPVSASSSSGVIDVNIKEVGGNSLGHFDAIPVDVQNDELKIEGTVEIE